MPVEIEKLSAHVGRPAIYDWEAWTDGKARLFTRGSKEQVADGTADFVCKSPSFGNAARKAALERGLGVSVRNPSENTVEIQTTGPIKPKASAPAVETDDIPSAS
jgi:hypothetical protein